MIALAATAAARSPTLPPRVATPVQPMTTVRLVEFAGRSTPPGRMLCVVHVTPGGSCHAWAARETTPRCRAVAGAIASAPPPFIDSVKVPYVIRHKDVVSNTLTAATQYSEGFSHLGANDNAGANAGYRSRSYRPVLRSRRGRRSEREVQHAATGNHADFLRTSVRAARWASQTCAVLRAPAPRIPHRPARRTPSVERLGRACPRRNEALRSPARSVVTA